MKKVSDASHVIMSRISRTAPVTIRATPDNVVLQFFMTIPAYTQAVRSLMGVTVQMALIQYTDQVMVRS